MINAGMIGAGYFGQFHAEAWQRLEGVELKAIAEANEKRRKELKELFPGVTLYADWQSMLASEKLDLVDITTSPVTHKELVCGILGKVDIAICQKPFCNSLEEAKEVVGHVAASRTKVVVHENFRFQSWYREIRDLLGAGRIGTVLQAEYRLRPGDGQGEDAYLARQPYFRQMKRFLVHETAIHLVDTFRFLFGEPDSVYADLRKVNPVIEGEDAGFIVFGYPNGLRAVFDGNRCLDHAAENRRLTMGEMRVEGTLGTISLYGDGSIWIRNFDENEPISHKYDFSDFAFGGDCVYLLQSHVVDFIKERGDLENEVGEYVRNLEIEESIYESASAACKMTV